MGCLGSLLGILENCRNDILARRKVAYNSIIWLHGILAKFSSYCVGVDINKRGIELMRKHGYTCYIADIEKPFDLKMKFDIAIASKVIYYLSGLKTFMDNVKRHLKPHGALVIAVENPFFLKRVLEAVKGPEIKYISGSLALYDLRRLINLVERFNLKPIECYYSYFLLKPKKSCI